MTNNSVLIDFTYASKPSCYDDDIDVNIHQGFETYRDHLKSEKNGEDDVYNRQFLFKPVRTCKDASLKVCPNGLISDIC